MPNLSDTSPMRLHDGDTVSLRVTRSVPVWSLIAGAIAVVVQAVTLHLGQVRQAELIAGLSQKIAEQNVGIERLVARMEGLAERTNEAKNSAARADYKLEDVERRVSALERATGGRRP